MGRRRQRGGGSTYQRSDAKWVAALPLGGGQRRVVYARTRAEAQARLAELIVARDQGTLANPSTVTVGKWIADYLADRADEIRPRTRAFYADVHRLYIEPGLGGRRLQALKPPDIRAWLRGLNARKVSMHARRRALQLLRASLRYAVRQEVLTRNPADAVELRGAGGSRAVTAEQVWTREHVTAFLEVAKGDRLYALFFTALTCGLRRGELFGLRWTDVDLDAGRLEVRHAIIVATGGQLVESSPKTRKGFRTVYLAPDGRQVLREHRERQIVERELAAEIWQDHTLVFPSSIGTPLQPGNVRRAFTAITARAGVPRLRIHDMRHSYATLAGRAGVPIEAISERLGHSRTSITSDIYRHLLEVERREAALSLSDLLAGPGPRAQG